MFEKAKASESPWQAAAAAAASTRQWWGFLLFFALLKIMVTYISFNEGNYRFLLPSLCAQSFVSNEIKAAPKQWMLAFYQSTQRRERKKVPECSNAREGRTKAEARERAERDREVVFALFFMEAKSSSRFHVVISISNYPIPKRLHPFGEVTQ